MCVLVCLCVQVMYLVHTHTHKHTHKQTLKHTHTARDHLVGWANSSLRYLHSLPRLPYEHQSAKGVVVEDPLLSAFDARYEFVCVTNSAHAQISMFTCMLC